MGARRWRTWTGPAGGASAATKRSRPGELVHVDVKKLGNIPDGGGWRVLGKPRGKHNHQAHRGSSRRTRYYNPLLGYAYLHTALDDHSRLAYTEILRLKPSAAKGRYLKKAAITSTMGPSIPVDPAKTRGLIEETEAAVG